MILLCLCSACSIFDNITEKPEDINPFLRVYKEQDLEYEINTEKEVVEVEKVTFSVDKISFFLFSKWFSDKSTNGLIYSSDLDNVQISGSWTDSTYEEILNSVARRHNMDIIKIGNTYYVGLLKPEDRATFVKQVWGYTPEEILSIASIMLSDQGKAYVTKDNLLTVSDKTSVIMSIQSIVDTINSIDKSTWICQLYLVYYRKKKLLEYGTKLKPTADIAYRLSNQNLDDMTNGLNYNADINALISADFNSSFTKLLASPMLLVRNGQKAYWTDGERIPIPLYTKSEYGVVTISGYEYQNTGLTVNINIIESTNGTGILNLDITNTIVSGYVEQAPIIAGTDLTSTTNIQSSGVYLLAEINAHQSDEQLKSWFFEGDGDNSIKFQVWAKIFKIQGFTEKKLNVDSSAETADQAEPDESE